MPRRVGLALLLLAVSSCATTQLHLRDGESVRGTIEHSTEDTYFIDTGGKGELVAVPTRDVEDATFAGAPLRIVGGSLLFGGGAPFAFISLAAATGSPYGTCDGCLRMLIPFGTITLAGLLAIAVGAAVRGDGRSHLRFDPPSLIRRNRKLGRLFLVFGVSMGASSTLAFFEGDTELSGAIGWGLVAVGATLTMFGLGYLIRGLRMRSGRRERRVAFGPRGLVFDASL
jgi:hypothetical protein